MFLCNIGKQSKSQHLFLQSVVNLAQSNIYPDYLGLFLVEFLVDTSSGVFADYSEITSFHFLLLWGVSGGLGL